jgi:hypothetical protein
MGSNTVEPTKIIYIECMNFKPHDPHTWREGFLWHSKKTCGGVPEWVQTPDEETHRHYFGVRPEQCDAITIVWECLDPFCDEVYEKFRMFYNWETLTNRRQVIYKKQKI